MPLVALSPALRALYDEVDAILSQPIPELPGRVVRPVTPEAAYAWEQEHRGAWIDDVEARIRRFAATPALASDDEVRMAAALRGLALAELQWRESILQDVHSWRLARWFRGQTGRESPDPAIERAIEAAQQRAFTLGAAAADAFRSCGRGATLHDVSSWWALCREQVQAGGLRFTLPDRSEERVTSPCAAPHPVRLRAPFHGASALHVVVEDSQDLLTPELRISLRELTVAWLRAEGFDVASTAETDQTAERAVAACARPISIESWRHTSLVATVGLSCESDGSVSRETCRIELSASPREWVARVAAPISARSLRSAMSRLREGRAMGVIGRIWPHWGLSGETDLALMQALPTEDQLVFAESATHAANAATRSALERCVLDDEVRRARLDLCVDVAPDGRVSSAVVATDPYASRPLDRAAARAYRSAAGRREPTRFHRCVLDAAMNIRFPCITETTRVGSRVDVTVQEPPTTPDESAHAEPE